MKVSVCITVFNEEKSISKLIESLLNQEKKPNEIVIVDGGSTDKTVELIRYSQEKDKRIKLVVQKCGRSEGRNLSIDLAKNRIIATTDADCLAKKSWLKKLSEPFKHKEVDISAGFYTMKTENDFQKAISYYLGVVPSKFNENFLPSTRSMAFRKSVWEKIGGFPEREDNSAEDTDFNKKAIEMGMRYARVKDARVEWRIPVDCKGFVKKIYDYAKWDAKYGDWWHPQKHLASHNIKAVFKLLRYILGFILVYYALKNIYIWTFLFLGVFTYSFWAFRKVYKEFRSVKVGLFGVLLQYSTDFAVMIGFVKGLIR